MTIKFAVNFTLTGTPRQSKRRFNTYAEAIDYGHKAVYRFNKLFGKSSLEPPVDFDEYDGPNTLPGHPYDEGPYFDQLEEQFESMWYE